MPITATDVLRRLPREAPAFDQIAEEYDQVFTHSVIGQAQRSLVHAALRGHFHAGQHILELNCGTGEDAMHLASQGISVFACDVSERMIKVARAKNSHSESDVPVTYVVCANENLDWLRGNAPFDGALSNFGGLNCTADLARVAEQLGDLIRPGGQIFLCFLGRVCAWDILWHGVHGRWSKAFQRLKAGGTEARIGATKIRVYYPSSREVWKAFAPAFKLVATRGIGVTLPPSWMEHSFRNRPGLVERLTRLDQWLGALPVFRGVADHVLYQFVRESK